MGNNNKEKLKAAFLSLPKICLRVFLLLKSQSPLQMNTTTISAFQTFKKYKTHFSNRYFKVDRTHAKQY